MSDNERGFHYYFGLSNSLVIVTVGAAAREPKNVKVLFICFGSSLLLSNKGFLMFYEAKTFSPLIVKANYKFCIKIKFR